MYVRKLLFSRKDYDLCDNFPKLVVQTKKNYYILRKAPVAQQRSMLSDMIRLGMGLVLVEEGLDRRHLLYNRKGHKKIQIKRVTEPKLKVDWERVQNASSRVDRLYQSYDRLLGM